MQALSPYNRYCDYAHRPSAFDPPICLGDRVRSRAFALHVYLLRPFLRPFCRLCRRAVRRTVLQVCFFHHSYGTGELNFCRGLDMPIYEEIKTPRVFFSPGPQLRILHTHTDSTGHLLSFKSTNVSTVTCPNLRPILIQAALPSSRSQIQRSVTTYPPQTTKPSLIPAACSISSNVQVPFWLLHSRGLYGPEGQCKFCGACFP